MRRMLREGPRSPFSPSRQSNKALAGAGMKGFLHKGKVRVRQTLLSLSETSPLKPATELSLQSHCWSCSFPLQSSQETAEPLFTASPHPQPCRKGDFPPASEVPSLLERCWGGREHEHCCPWHVTGSPCQPPMVAPLAAAILHPPAPARPFLPLPFPREQPR